MSRPVSIPRRCPRLGAPLSACLLGLALAVVLGCGDDGGGGEPVRTLAFVDQPPPGTGAFVPMASDVTVEFLDEDGQRVDTDDVVTLSIGDDVGALLLHASGRSNIDPSVSIESRMLELVDGADGAEAKLHWLEYEWGGPEATSLAFDAAAHEFHLATRLNLDFFDGDPVTGETTLVGARTTDNFKGMAYWVDPALVDPTPEDATLLGVVSKNSELDENGLFEIDPATGVPSLLGVLTPDLGKINGFNGLATDPVTGTLYAAVELGQLGLVGRSLMSIDVENRTATFLCELRPATPTDSARVASIAVANDGSIFAVTGESSRDPIPPANTETLYRVEIPDPVDVGTPCTMTEIMQLGAGDDGEAITAIATQMRGTTSVAAVNGLATFSGLQLAAVGAGFTLEATAANATPVTSASFDITAPDRTGDVQFAVTAENPDEGTGTDTVVTYTVEYAGGGSQTNDVIVTMSAGGSAADVNAADGDSDLDYEKYLQLTIPAGQSSAQGQITITGDDVAEAMPDETIVLYIEDASLAAGIVDANRTLTITITDDD